MRIKSNGDPRKLGQRGYFVKSVRINGETWDKNWFNHEDVMVEGGMIEFDVGDEEVVWEGGEVPPSLGNIHDAHSSERFPQKKFHSKFAR